MTFDPSLPTRTRDGRKVRILATDLRDRLQPIVAAVSRYGDEGGDLVETVETYSLSGRYNPERPTGWDLVNVDA